MIINLNTPKKWKQIKLQETQFGKQIEITQAIHQKAPRVG